MINTKLIYCKKETEFIDKLSSNLISNNSIVFIEDTQQIWTHGKYFIEHFNLPNNPTFRTVTVRQDSSSTQFKLNPMSNVLSLLADSTVVMQINTVTKTLDLKAANQYNLNVNTLVASTIQLANGKDTHVLLAGGGTKALSELGGVASTSTFESLTIAKSGSSKGWTLGYNEDDYFSFNYRDYYPICFNNEDRQIIFSDYTSIFKSPIYISNGSSGFTIEYSNYILSISDGNRSIDIDSDIYSVLASDWALIINKVSTYNFSILGGDSSKLLCGNGSAISIDQIFTPATSSSIGAIKPIKSYTVSANFSTTGISSNTPTINTVTTKAGCYYAVEVDKDGRAFVNVPINTYNEVGSNYYQYYDVGTTSFVPGLTVFAGQPSDTGLSDSAGIITFNPYTPKDSVTTLFDGLLGQLALVEDGTLWFRHNDSDAENWSSWERVQIGSTFTTSVYAPSFYESSDVTLKDNIKNISSVDYIKLDCIDFKEFTFKGDTTKRYGVIAQELEKAGLTNLVKGKEGSKSVDYISLLILEVQRLRKEIENMKKQISACN